MASSAWLKIRERIRASLSGSSREGSAASSTDGLHKEDYDGDALENWVFVDESEALMKFHGPGEQLEKETAGEPSTVVLRRKFITLSGNYQSFAEALGGKVVAEDHGFDQYFDFKDYRLALNHYALRLRNDHVWTLWYPLDSRAEVAVDTLFGQTEDEASIVALLPTWAELDETEAQTAAETKDPAFVKSALSRWLESGRLIPVAKLERRNCRLEVNECHIDLEEMGPGCLLADVEAKVSSWVRVDTALARMDELAAKLGLVPLAQCDWTELLDKIGLAALP